MSLLANWNGNTISRSGKFYNDCWGYVDEQGKEYAIIGSPRKIHILDISEPSTPILLKEITGGSASLWRDFKTYSCYAYGVADEGNEGLIVIDLCNLPTGPIYKANQKKEVFSKAHNLFVDVSAGRLYVLGANTRSNGIIIYDLNTTPSNPQLLASVNLPGGYIHDAFIKNNIAYCSHGNSGLYIYDLSDPLSPQYKASINTGAYNHSNWLTEDETHLIYAEEVPIGLPLRMVDLSNIEEDDLQITSTFSSSLLPATSGQVTYHNPFIIDNYAVISSYEDGVTIFNIANKTAPTRVAYYDTYVNDTYSGFDGCWGVYPYFPSGTIIASDGINGLFVLSTTIPLSTDCFNGQLDSFEQQVDQGGFCKSPSRVSTNNTSCSDFDKDGYPADQDCNDANPLIPATPGTSCNDGNPNTINDSILADGCTCQGS